MSEVWSGVRERVLALRDAPYWRKVFGAEFGTYGHRFELRDVLTEAEVAQAERHLGLTLPHEYRTFLLEVGAGGAGPDYGLFPVRHADPASPYLAERVALPFVPERTEELDAHWESEPQPADYGDSDEEQDRRQREYAAWQKRHDELEDTLSDGTLCISEQGCAYYTLLAVTGPESGTVWDDVRAVGEGVVPAARNGQDRLTFAQWYLRWLEYAERTAWQEPKPRS